MSFESFGLASVMLMYAAKCSVKIELKVTSGVFTFLNITNPMPMPLAMT